MDSISSSHTSKLFFHPMLLYVICSVGYMQILLKTGTREGASLVYQSRKLTEIMEYLQTKVLDGMMEELLEEFEPMYVLDQLVQKNIVDTEGEKQIKARKFRKERVMTTMSTLQPMHYDDRWLLRFAEVLEVSAWYGTLGEKLRKETHCAMKEVKDIQELYSVSEESFIRLSHLLKIATAIQESDARKILEYLQVPNTNSNDLGKTLVTFLLYQKIPIIRLKEACSKYNLKYLQDINAKHDMILSFPELQGNFLVKLPASRSHKKVSLLESGTLWESSLFPKETSVKLYVFFRGEYGIHFVKLCNKAKSLRLRIESKRTLDKLLEENEAGVFGTNVVKLLFKSINGSESTPNIRLDFSKSKLENVRKKLPTVGDTSSLSSCSSLASFDAGYSEEQSTFDYIDMMDRLTQAINISDIKLLCAYLKINRVDNILGSENPRQKFIHVCRQSKIWTSKDTSRLVEAVRSNKLTNLENIVTGKKNDMSLWPEVTVKITPTKPYDTTFTKFKQFILRRKGVAKSKVEKEVGLNLLFKVSTAESIGKLKKDIDSGRFLQELLRIYKDETGDLMTSKAERESIKLTYDEDQFKELLQHVATEEKSRQHTFEYLDMMDRLIETMGVSDIDLLCKYFDMDHKSLERIQGSINPKREFIHVCRRKKIWTSGDTLHLLEAVRSTQLTRLQGIIEDFNDMSLCPEVTLMMKSNSPSGAFAELEEFLLSSKKRLDTEFRREFKVHLVDCEKGSLLFRLKVPSKDSLDQLMGDIHSGRLLKKLMTIYNEQTKIEAPILEDGKLSIKLSYDTKEVKGASNVLKQPTFSIKDQWKRALMRVQTLMEEDFDPFSLMEILTSNGTLTSTDVDALKATAKRKQRVRLFISFLETKEETAFNSFRLALEGCSYYEELAKALNSEVKGSQSGYLLSGVTEDMTEGRQVSGKTDEISQQCSTEEVDFDIFLDSCGKWNIERAPTKRFVEEEQMVASASTFKHFKTTKVLEKGDIYPGTKSNVGNERKDMNDPGDIFIHKQEREKTIVTEKWKKLEEKFYNPSFFCEHDSIHQYQDISRDINVLLIGKCGAGKSATGNTLLGEKIFEEGDNDAPETKSVKFETIQEGTFNITVVDTPGIQNEELLLNVVEEMIDFEGGIHIFLVVCEDKADQEITKVISRILVKTACDQCVVVFTNARARFVGQKKMSGYIDRQKDREGPLADLFQRVENRIIAVENCFDEEDVTIIYQQRQKLLCCLAQVIKDNKGLAYTKESFRNAKTRITQYQDMEGRLHEFLLHTYLKTLSQQQLGNIQTTLDGNVKDIMQACKVLELCPLITEGDAMQYMRLFIQENEKEISKIQADIEIWRALEEKFYCIKCEYDNIGDYKDVPEEMNILLIGKTGSGKSATGNTIIGGNSFEESGSSTSVTKTIDKKEIHESGIHITVIDTPGLFDTANDFKNEDNVLEIAKTMINFKGGIHLFLLIVSSTSRFTKEEQDTIKDIEKILGKDVYKNCILVLTYARAKFVSDNSLQDYVKKETEVKGKFGNLLNHVDNRIIAVENVFDDEFLTKKHRQKLLSCFAHIIHENKGSVYSNKAFKYAKARVDQQEEERKKRVAREADLTHMKNTLRKFLREEYLEHLTEKELDNILPKVQNETFLIMTRSGVKQLSCITSEDVKTYTETFIQENGVLISKLKDLKIQEAEQQKEYEETKKRLKYEEDINKMQSIALPLVSNYLKQQSKQELEEIIRHNQLPGDLTNQIIAALESNDVDVELEQIESYFQEYFKNPKQIQGYIVKLEEKSKKVQREQRLNEIMGTLEKTLNKHLESKDCEELKKLRTDLEGNEHSGPGNWVSILTELVGSQIKGSDKNIIEVTNLFLKQNNNRIQSILEILLDKRQKQQEAKLLKEKEELRNSAFSIISREIREKLKSYLIGKSTDELLKLEKQIANNKVPKDVFDKINEQLTNVQKQSLSPKDINDEILKQINEQSKVIEECKKEIGVCFAGSSEVRIKERGIDKISNVRVDDEILVFDENGLLFYDKVYLISHAREDENITFVRLQTSSDKNLRISPGHLLLVGSLCSNVAAKDVSLGNVIFTLQDGVMMPDKVTSVTYELCRGAYCPMTMNGTIAVNDVAASCYTSFFPAPLAHALLSPIRLLFSYLPLPLFNKLLPYDIEEGMPVLLLKCRSIVNMWRSLFTRNDKPIKSV